MPTSWARKGTVHISVLKIEKNQRFKRATSASAKSSSAEIHGPFKDLVGFFLPPQRVKSASWHGRVNRHLYISYETLSSSLNSAGASLEYFHLLGYLCMLRGDPFKSAPFSQNQEIFSSTLILDLFNCGSTRSPPRRALSLLHPPQSSCEPQHSSGSSPCVWAPLNFSLKP